MPSHPQDLHVIMEIEDQIKVLTKHHRTHKVILSRDCNIDIMLHGHINDDSP